MSALTAKEISEVRALLAARTPVVAASAAEPVAPLYVAELKENQKMADCGHRVNRARSTKRAGKLLCHKCWNKGR